MVIETVMDGIFALSAAKPFLLQNNILGLSLLSFDLQLSISYVVDPGWSGVFPSTQTISTHRDS
jgi:hypothetical protein